MMTRLVVTFFFAACCRTLLAQTPAAAPPGRAPSVSVVLAGGCFWGVEAVFEHLRGVESVTSGYARDARSTLPTEVEAVRVVYDPARISLGQLLNVFFVVAHDPTQRDRQGPDRGPEYRGVVFYGNPDERQAAANFMTRLEAGRHFPGPIVTELLDLGQFRVAEPFHQNYAARHPRDPYIVRNDLPKLERLKQAFSSLFQESRAP
jgi:peptide-methionine (S)-S-oxide reductase